MSESIDYQTAKDIMGDNFIGIEELQSHEFMPLLFDGDIPRIPYSYDLLKKKSHDYLLILGISKLIDGTPVSIRSIKKYFGQNPEVMEPCFYNQDWYDNEEFMDIAIRDGWYLIRKNVYEESRAIQPNELIKHYEFPLAIECTYAFFAAWKVMNIKLWRHDYVWCRDLDHNGDRVYVGKYHDKDGLNKNGFSIHRHLSLRTCYACID